MINDIINPIKILLVTICLAAPIASFAQWPKSAQTLATKMGAPSNTSTKQATKSSAQTTTTTASKSSNSILEAAKKKKAEADAKRKAEDDAFKVAIDEGTKSALINFQNKFPNGVNKSECTNRIKELDAFERAHNTNTIKAYKSLLQSARYDETKNLAQREITRLEDLELKDFEAAKNKRTRAALNEFITTHPDSKYIVDAENCLADFELFEQALNVNTINAYNHYITQTKNGAFVSDAKKHISDIEMENRWRSISSHPTLQSVKEFIADYPNSQYKNKAEQLQHALQGEVYYKSGAYKIALQEFNNVPLSDLTASQRKMRREASEYIDYCNLSETSSESELKDFLSKYKDGAYADNVSNMLALKMSKSLTQYDSDQAFAEAKSYAKDAATLTAVNRNIAIAKQAKKQYEKDLKKARWAEDGGFGDFCIELLDMNFSLSKKYGTVFQYNLAVGYRFGNYRTPVQFEVGIKPGVIHTGDDIISSSDDVYPDYYYPYDYYYASNPQSRYSSYSSYDEGTTKFHMPVYGRLKINLGGNSAKWYISGTFFWNAVRFKEIETKMSIQGGTGVCWKHCDWQILYFRKDLGKTDLNESGNCYLGSSMGFYF